MLNWLGKCSMSRSQVQISGISVYWHWL